jgi:hypothetical protein
MAASDLDTGAVDAAQFARSVATTPDAELAAGMRGELRGQILDEIFRRMEQHFRPDAAHAVDAVVHFHITDGGDDRSRSGATSSSRRRCPGCSGFRAASGGRAGGRAASWARP